VTHQVQIPRLVETVMEGVVRDLAEHGKHLLTGLA